MQCMRELRIFTAHVQSFSDAESLSKGQQLTTESEVGASAAFAKWRLCTYGGSGGASSPARTASRTTSAGAAAPRGH